MHLFNPYNIHLGKYCDYSYLTEGEIEAQKIKKLDQDDRTSKF